MTPDALEILAEVAVGIAGFGTIAIVLGSNRRGWEAADYYRSSALLATSLGALFLALLPIGLAALPLSIEDAWRAGSASMALATLLVMVYLRRLRSRHLDPELYLGPLLIGVVAVSAVANAVAQGVNASGLLWAASGGVYYFGVIWFLMFACLFFVRIVFYRPLGEREE